MGSNIIQKGPESPPVHSPVAHWMQEGRRRISCGDPEGAIRCFRSASATGEDPELVRFWTATAWLCAGETARAIPDLLALADSRGPLAGEASHNLGIALHRSGDPAGALAAFRLAAPLRQRAWSSWQSIAELTQDEDERLAAIDVRATVPGAH